MATFPTLALTDIVWGNVLLIIYIDQTVFQWWSNTKVLPLQQQGLTYRNHNQCIQWHLKPQTLYRPVSWHLTARILARRFSSSSSSIEGANSVTSNIAIVPRAQNSCAPWKLCSNNDINQPPHHTTTVVRPFLRDHPGEPVPEENFWTLWCKGRLTEADTLTIRLGSTPSGLTSAHLHHTPMRYWDKPIQDKINSVQLDKYDDAGTWLDELDRAQTSLEAVRCTTPACHILHRPTTMPWLDLWAEFF